MHRRLRFIIESIPAAIWALVLTFGYFAYRWSFERETATHPSWLPAVLLLGGFAAYFLQIYAGLRGSHLSAANSRHSIVAACLTQATVLFAITALLLFAESYFGMHLHRAWVGVLLSGLSLWIIETSGRSLGRLFQPARFRSQLLPAGISRVLLPFASAEARHSWKTATSSDAPTIALSDMWFVPTLRKLLVPLLLGTSLLLWLASSLHEIPHGHVGLRSRFGKLDAVPLEAGFHASLPFPFATVEVLPKDRLQEVVLGSDADTGKPILWDRDHYLGEENQLVGHGEELLTISVPIYFYLRDPLAFYKNTIDARKTVRDLARQELLAITMHQSAFSIMTEDRVALAHTLKTNLQAALDRRKSGIAVAMVCLRDIHPPVQVAPAFQEVVSALEEREEAVHAGEAYRADNLPKAISAAYQVRSQADTALARRVAEVGGQVASFNLLQASYAAAPEVFRIRQSYEAFDLSLRGVRKIIMDESYRGKVPTVVDTRKTLNPDFNPLPNAETPSLIPSLGDKISDFDRSIDNYLHAGQGAIPAPAPHAPDPDNLLQQKQ
jgi:regulator of protease activity HflC (stomatin/prohibitin superfamily)